MIRRQNRMKTSPGAAAMEILRKQGRYGDTELAHVNPREKALLKALGGAGSRNPRTGLKEFYEPMPSASLGGQNVRRLDEITAEDQAEIDRIDSLLEDSLRNLAPGEPAQFLRGRDTFLASRGREASGPRDEMDGRYARLGGQYVRRLDEITPRDQAEIDRIDNLIRNALMNLAPGEPARFMQGPMSFLASQGRYGDTEIAPLTPREMEILKSLGGAGTINPRTGLREFYEAGVDVGGGDQGPSAQGDLGMGSGPSFGPDGSSNAGVDYGVEFGPTAPPNPVQTGMARIGEVLMDPDAIPGFGILGQALGRPISALNREARAAGYDVQDPISERSAFEAGFPGNLGTGLGEMRNEAFVPVANPTPRYLRGGEMAPPQEISSFIGPGMSDIQQRALISTYGTQGVNSAFRTDPVRRYYANLLSRGLISDAGAPVQNPYVLPIEQQYASSVLGRPFANPADAAATYEAIRGFL
jgi:hypothetical protein